MKTIASKRILVMALCVIMLVGLMVPSLAFAAASVTDATGRAVTLQVTTVHSGPSYSYASLGSVALGTWLDITGVASNNWYRVKYNGGIGYVDGAMVNAFMDTTGVPSPSDPNSVLGTYITNVAVNVYSRATTTSSLVTTLPKGTTVNKIGYIGNWSQITYGNIVGYVYSTYLNYVSGGSGGIVIVTPPPSVVPSDATHTVTAARLNVRTGPGTSYAKIGVLTAGTAVVRIATSGNWSEIKYGTGTGYVSSKYLKAAGTSSGTATTTLISVYAGPATSYTVVGTVKVGALITRLGVSGDWVMISDGTVTGYVKNTNLSGNYVIASPSGSTTTVVGTKYKVNTQKLNVRYGPSTKYAVICTVDYATVVTVLETTGKWSKIQLSNNTVGYVASRYLTLA